MLLGGLGPDWTAAVGWEQGVGGPELRQIKLQLLGLPLQQCWDVDLPLPDSRSKSD
jgi:hypothetical protein